MPRNNCLSIEMEGKQDIRLDCYEWIVFFSYAEIIEF